MVSVKYAAKRLLWQTVPRVYPRVQDRAEQEFSIGIAVGESPFKLRPSVEQAVLTRHDVTDVPATLVADPFMCRDGDQWCMFFEVVNHLTRRGEIGLALSQDGLRWKYQRIVLAEPFHLSYPHLFEWRGTQYMIPESSRARAVRLYRATRFPFEWQHVGNLLEAGRYADSSIFHYRGRWWLFTEGSEVATQPILRLFFADEPIGPWQEHPLSPICSGNPHIARPGGKVVVMGDMPVRFAQDIFPDYGRRVFALAITTLSTTEYEEHPIGTGPILDARAEKWCNGGMHHIDAHLRPDGSWIACVDGFRQYAEAVA